MERENNAAQQEESRESKRDAEGCLSARCGLSACSLEDVAMKSRQWRILESDKKQRARNEMLLHGRERDVKT